MNRLCIKFTRAGQNVSAMTVANQSQPEMVFRHGGNSITLDCEHYEFCVKIGETQCKMLAGREPMTVAYDSFLTVERAIEFVSAANEMVVALNSHITETRAVYMGICDSMFPLQCDSRRVG